MRAISRDLYPFEHHYLDIGGHRVHYIEEGGGEPVIMVHGNPSWSIYFREIVKKLSGRYHCIVPDHIGMGFSDKPGDRTYAYTVEQRAKDLEAFLEAKGIDRDITLMMHDWGGPIGMGFARRHPGAIKRIILMNTAAFLIPKEKALPFVLRLSRSWVGAFFVRATPVFCLGTTYSGLTRRKMDASLRSAYIAPYNSWNNRIGLLRFVQDIPLKDSDPGYAFAVDLQDHLHLFRDVPVLILWGMQDFVFDGHFLDKWIEYLPNAEVHRFEDCGHYILEDAPEETGQIIENFLQAE